MVYMLIIVNHQAKFILWCVFQKYIFKLKKEKRMRLIFDLRAIYDSLSNLIKYNIVYSYNVLNIIRINFKIKTLLMTLFYT